MIENIPEPLRSCKRWVSFSVIRQPDGSSKKFPLTVRGSLARSDHPEDWDTLPEVEKAIEYSIGRYPAIALGADYPLRVYDLDGCIEDGKLSPLAEKIVSLSTNSYIERSISGRGLHILSWSTGTQIPCNPCPGLEVYGGAPRFIIFTGDLWT